MAELIDRNGFIEGVKTLFPESLGEMFDLEDELLHVDMGNFARTTNSAISNSNWTLVRKHFEFVSNLFEQANFELENAIYVSYLENVLLDRTEQEYKEARKILPSNLEAALVDLEKHFKKIYEISKNT